MQLHFLITFLIIFTGCKTADDIRREQAVDTMSVQVIEQQKQLTDNNFKIQEIDQRLNQIYGQLEETQTDAKQRILEKEKERQNTLTQINDRIELIESRLDEMEEGLKQQSEFIKEVTSTLKGFQSKSSAKTSDPYRKAINLYERGKYKAAKPELAELLKQKSLSAVRKVRVHYALGTISMKEKSYENALVHYSWIYTKYPKSSRAPGSLLGIAKSFIATNQKAEAKESLKQFINQYPNSKEITEANKLLQGL